jgi:phenylacetate-coenzyme A ligase PaaK-like adenylate-forming protein
MKGGCPPVIFDQGQMEKLREVVAYARDHSRIYHEKLHPIEPGSLASSADLEKLPFTFPAELAQDPLSFLCVSQGEVARVTTLTTSGTSGSKKRIFFTAHDLERTVDFFACGMRTMVSAGQHTLILMSGETESSIGRLLQTALLRIGVTSRIGCRDWSDRDARAAAKTADCIVGIPSQILYLCRKDRSLRPKSVLLSADFVPRCVIRAIEKDWECRVFTHYGLTETGFGCAVQCASREGHHLRDAELLIEIVDPQAGTRLAPGELGEIVITTLCNEAMPLIRYRTGDLSRMSVGPCGCGSTLPRLGRVDGRRENELRISGGSTLSIHQLDELLFAIPKVYGFEAGLRREGDRSILSLTVEAEGSIERELAAAKLFGGIAVEVRYAEVRSFPIKAKRCIHTG